MTDVKRTNFDDGSYMVETSGVIRYFNKDNQTHRDNDLPAILLTEDGVTHYHLRWYQNGKLHRIGNPAITSYSVIDNTEFSEFWYHDGILTNIDGYAIRYFNGNVAYYIDNVKRTEEEWESESLRIKLITALSLNAK